MSTGFFNDKQVKNEHADELWKKSDRDWVLDTYFSGGEGASPKRMAQKLGRNLKAVKRLLDKYTYNEQDKVLKYQPFRRIGRKGKKFTQNEVAVCRALREKGVPAADVARLLQRDSEELTKQKEQKLVAQRSLRSLALSLDVIWAHRYIYFVWKKPIIPDDVYDALVKEEIEYGGGSVAFERIRSYKGWPLRIRSLAMYLREREEGK